MMSVFGLSRGEADDVVYDTEGGGGKGTTGAIKINRPMKREKALLCAIPPGSAGLHLDLMEISSGLYRAILR
jgi:hypothetical protein